MEYIKSKYICYWDIMNGNEYFIYHRFFGNIMKINYMTKIFIDYFQDPHTINDFIRSNQNYSIEEINQTLMLCLEKKFIYSLKKDFDEYELVKYDKNFNNYGTKYLRLYITQNCNFKCTYCFEKKHSGFEYMSLETIINSFYAFKKYLDSGDCLNTIKINYYGGEPLLRFDIIETSLPYLRKIFKEYKSVIKITINTNGTLLNREIIEWAIKNKIHFYISIDGSKNTNDKNRIFQNGRGTYEEIIKKIKLLVEIASTEYITEFLTILVTVTSENLFDIKNLIAILEKLGVKNISLNVAFTCAIGNMKNENWNNLSTKELDYFINTILEMQEKKFDSGLHIGGMWGYLQQRILKGGSVFCQACGNEIGVSAEGKLFACPCTLDHEKYSIGYLSKDSFVFNSNFKYFLNRKVYNIPKCEDCGISGICRGGCPATSILNNKTIYDPIQCDFWLKFINEFLKIQANRYK